MPNLFNLEIITPERVFFNSDVEMVVLQAVDGEMGILYGHEPVIISLGIGKLKIKIDGTWKEAALSGGIAEVEPNKTMILTDAIEWPEEIDKQRAEQAKERAENKLKQKLSGDEFERYQAALERAINRIRMAEKNQSEK
ncbi:ATP synthase F1 subunit epsilon [Caldicellulosiruptoraceae bacterium PP1]